MTRLVRSFLICFSISIICINTLKTNDLPDWDLFNELEDMENNSVIDPDFLGPD